MAQTLVYFWDFRSRFLFPDNARGKLSSREKNSLHISALRVATFKMWSNMPSKSQHWDGDANQNIFRRRVVKRCSLDLPNSEMPGTRLQRLRNMLGFSMREVEGATRRIAAAKGHQDFMISISRLYDIEHGEIVPSIFRMYSLATVYHKRVGELLSWYGVDPHQGGEGVSEFNPPKTRRFTLSQNSEEACSAALSFDVFKKHTIPAGNIAE